MISLKKDGKFQKDRKFQKTYFYRFHIIVSRSNDRYILAFTQRINEA